MKVLIPASALCMLAFLSSGVSAQEAVPNQNPMHQVSREKYMHMADSINQWHGTTFQETYTAFDWYENKIKRPQEREEFRREMRRQRAGRYYYHQPGYNSPYHHRHYRSYYNPYRYNSWPLYLFWF